MSFDDIERTEPKTDEPKNQGGRGAKLFEGCSLITLIVLSLLCLGIGIAVIVVPAAWVSSGLVVRPGTTQGQISNSSCPSVTPATAPASTMAVAASRQAFVSAWDEYYTTTMGRAEGVRAGCEPMRFPARGPTYKGVAVVWHGFSSCPQEMANLGPPLAAHGYDVLFPLMAGHGNALMYVAESPSFLWGFLCVAFGLLVLSVLCCIRLVPCAKCCDNRRCAPCCDSDGDGAGCCSYTDPKQACGHRNRTICVCTTAALSLILTLVGIVAWIITATSGSDFCLSLSFVDGVGPGCGASAVELGRPCFACNSCSQGPEIDPSLRRRHERVQRQLANERGGLPRWHRRDQRHRRALAGRQGRVRPLGWRRCRHVRRACHDNQRRRAGKGRRIPTRDLI